MTFDFFFWLIVVGCCQCFHRLLRCCFSHATAGLFLSAVPACYHEAVSVFLNCQYEAPSHRTETGIHSTLMITIVQPGCATLHPSHHRQCSGPVQPSNIAVWGQPTRHCVTAHTQAHRPRPTMLYWLTYYVTLLNAEIWHPMPLVLYADNAIKRNLYGSLPVGLILIVGSNWW